MKKNFIFKSALSTDAILVVVFMLHTSPYVFAHSSSQEGILAKSYLAEYGGYYIGGKDVGWSIDEGLHTNGTTLTYSFSSTDTYNPDFRGFPRVEMFSFQALLSVAEWKYL